ncbi:histone-lysine N-methyltransferase family member SUVH9-like [Olea europaea var. sylvestris]|uniref:Histone-lysine N-methyltransferase family member SUVH9-like n=1 Tax=Olea europaea subsp. europaea TaxID=158383 RepID=A0A8S0TTF7_OLEEU|nr:histone-lysine N-methyltransferase family member SUVH9-like [Olea europaea var. sylvestris]CAA3009230.1 histone-lysine N-methyltransferase family member SUVH9-like [Olea europaea subsp. europaea]
MEMGSSSSPTNAELTPNSHLFTTPQLPIPTPVSCSSSKPNTFVEILSALPDFSTIVPVNKEETLLSNSVDLPRGTPRCSQRSSKLVRVVDLKPHDHCYYREQIRRTRMLFENLRVCSIAEDEKNRNMLGPHKSTSWDVKAATIMKQSGLWLNFDKRIVGNIPGVYIGDVFFLRTEMCIIGLHGQPKAGIDYVPAHQSSNREPIATSIIVTEGYEDDDDAGDVIIYTGNGGKDKNNRQTMNQTLECGNLAMERSMQYGVELRVIRAFKYQGSISGKVYVYDGLYRVTDTWFDMGKSGFGVYKFKVVRIENQKEMGSAVIKLAKSLRVFPSEAPPKGYVTLDLSKKEENVPVLLFNEIDGVHEPLYYKYLKTTVFPRNVYEHGNGNGCECMGGCSWDCSCIEKNGGEFAYDMNGILVIGKPLIIECGPNCLCPPTCRNRVSQMGVKKRFEVFRSRETGWGVRSLDLIRAGSFICEFAGIVLTREQTQIVTMNGDCLIHPSRFSKRWEEWGDLSKIFPDYVRPAYPSIPPLDFAMDVSVMRNLACYMSHSSIPNVFVQLVLYDHNNVSFPHLMLFALENIPPMRELSLDYGVADLQF